MQRYFAKEKINDNFILYDTDIHHIKNVMRGKVDDEIEVVSENVVYICKISSLDPLTIEIVNTLSEDKELPVKLTVAVSLVNEQKFDLILQKLTELGVDQIIPVKTERSIVKLDNKKESKKISRWQMICKEASEQSKRTSIPTISDIITLKELKDNDTKLKLICSLNEKTKDISSYLNNDIKEVLFFVGPEGGFTNEEEKYLLDNNFKPVSLGKRVLRVETAAIYVASIINYIYRG
jgi:16S rRNA (uracil1498-N3)-methyltransferase